MAWPLATHKHDARLHAVRNRGRLPDVREEARSERALTVFADYVCPHSYHAAVDLGAIAGELGLEMEWRAYELTPAPLPTTMPRTRKAHEAAKFAATVAKGAAMHHAIFDAFFEGGRDIGRIDVLVEIGAALGIDRTELKVVLDVDSFTEAVMADRALAVRLEIDGTPAYMVDDDVRIGYMSPAHLRDWLGS